MKHTLQANTPNWHRNFQNWLFKNQVLTKSVFEPFWFKPDFDKVCQPKHYDAGVTTTKFVVAGYYAHLWCIPLHGATRKRKQPETIKASHIYTCRLKNQSGLTQATKSCISHEWKLLKRAARPSQGKPSTKILKIEFSKTNLLRTFW